jgi:pilus assembly protein CpaE
MDVVRSLSEQFGQSAGTAVGKTIAVVGARGGVGSSTVAHNLGYTIVRELDLASLIIDFDLPFGTVGLDFNQDPVSGVLDAIAEPERVDANMLDRLITACGDKLSILAAPSTLDRTYDFAFRNYEPMLDILRNTAPYILYDMPHQWTDWYKKVLQTADEIVVVCEPDLANLRNAKNLVDVFATMRKHDRKPHLVFNKVGVPKRPEISTAEFASALDLEPAAIIPFDPQLFGTASNNGQMLAEVQAGHKAAQAFPPLVSMITGKVERAPAKRASTAAMLQPLLAKLKRKA